VSCWGADRHCSRSPETRILNKWDRVKNICLRLPLQSINGNIPQIVFSNWQTANYRYLLHFSKTFYEQYLTNSTIKLGKKHTSPFFLPKKTIGFHSFLILPIVFHHCYYCVWYYTTFYQMSSNAIKILSIWQCCGSGSGIRCFFTPWMRDEFCPDPGWVIFLTLKTSSWNHKKHEKGTGTGSLYLSSLFYVRSGKKMFGSGMKKVIMRIRNKTSRIRNTGLSVGWHLSNIPSIIRCRQQTKIRLDLRILPPFGRYHSSWEADRKLRADSSYRPFLQTKNSPRYEIQKMINTIKLLQIHLHPHFLSVLLRALAI
jgi:hypothetical protein